MAACEASAQASSPTAPAAQAAAAAPPQQHQPPLRAVQESPQAMAGAPAGLAQQGPGQAGGRDGAQPGCGPTPGALRQGASAGARAGAGVLAAAVAVVRRALGPRQSAGARHQGALPERRSGAARTMPTTAFAKRGKHASRQGAPVRMNCGRNGGPRAGSLPLGRASALGPAEQQEQQVSSESPSTGEAAGEPADTGPAGASSPAAAPILSGPHSTT
eukprot:334285-Lingulodinium_polyedra.AAC.1